MFRSVDGTSRHQVDERSPARADMRASQTPAGTAFAGWSWRRGVVSWFAATIGSTFGAALGFVTSALIRSGDGFGEIGVILVFCAIYALIGTTVLGPPTFLILLRARRLSSGAFAIAGLLSGLGGVVALNAWGGYPQTNLLPETGAIAGACGALAFRRTWLRHDVAT
jgi:hypothetical protein